ncbi:Transcriptional regulator ManR [Sporomusa rhizae]|uniref:BglG family transcription antiterminator n=1 Tax=Sporomusa rhizae TaxID=357999 RepID=UPI00352BBFD2
MLKERCTQLLLHLIKADDMTTIAALAELLNVSKRTIRYDLDAVDDFLKSHGLPVLLRKQHGGVMLSQNASCRSQTLEFLHTANVYHYPFSSKEREILVIGQLMHNRDYTTIDDLAARLWVSRNTMIKDLQEVKAWYQRNGLELRSMPKYGIKVIGNERNFRRAAICFIKEGIGLEKALEILQKLSKTGQTGPSMYEFCQEWFYDVNFATIQAFIRVVEKELHTMFSDSAFIGLTFTIAIAVRRMQMGRDLVLTAEELHVLQNTAAFHVIREVTGQLEDYFNITVTLDEVGYLTEHILGSSVLSSAVHDSNNRMELDMLVCNLIAEVSRSLKQDLLADRQLYRGLMNELRPCIYRLKYGLVFDQSQLEELQGKYQQLFMVVRNHLKPVESYAGGKLTDAEAAHLTLHFSAALERIAPADKILPNVLVVCAAGLGTASLLAAKLQSIFDVHIVDMVACHQVGRILAEKHIDLIVSTVELKDIIVPAVTVSPLLPPQDVVVLKDYLDIVKVPKALLDKTLDIVGRHCVIRNYDQLYADLSKHFYSEEAVLSYSSQPALSDLLTGDRIELDVEAADWKEAIRAAGQLLLKTGCVEDAYIQAMITVVTELGPYIVLWPGIALPHAGTESGVRQLGISLVRLKHPVCFGHPENDPVRMVIALAAVDSSSHVMALLELTSMLGNTEAVRILLSLQNSRQVEEFIRKMDFSEC